MFIKEKMKVLCIGAHPDDIELGAAGFISKLISKHNADVHLLILTPGTSSWNIDEDFDKLQRVQEAKKAAKILGIQEKKVSIKNFQDRVLHQKNHEIIEIIEKYLYLSDFDYKFDLILTHAKGDTHQDHRQVYESTISATRFFKGTLLLFQAPSTIPNEFHPNFFVKLTEEELNKKELAISAHVGQRGKPYTSLKAIKSLAQAWASFHKIENGYIEAFEMYQSFLDITV